MLKGRLGLETARQPHADRHGLVWLDRGALTVEDGCLRFVAAGSDTVEAGDYRIPHQALSMVLLGPGSTVSHDALRILARHNTGLAAIGEGGVRFYTAQPLLPDSSALARRQAMAWADAKGGRMKVARRMYALRLGEVLPHRDIAVLRGIEGARVKEIYRQAAERHGIRWQGRRYDRQNPNAADIPNQALNHAASAVEGAAAIAVAATATIPQLGFVHEDSGQSFVLDVADLFRDTITVPCAFKAAKAHEKRPTDPIERLARRTVAERLRRDGVIPAMIDRIKTLFEDDAR
ncbi:type I-E CRISPR-associated endonuclease Cas1e [Methylobacterium platani]|uniref:CRISPR-associated endonuclease Cas1 n=2 Tax=Methylobacterium platani TaxID=427683 RepID=A0A179S8F5_9HYPH|nr:type I-E CRISPR-associated endonuclease Cas1e [Methylobacterium platani]KMO19535.1 CRISPR-associated protein Cas1 [Methylobacterium platani JCM 14648]OAS24023.1 subtype I-E CRISPR-associated endonuclease Cas1 [Methylobacterium platani]